MKNLRGLFFWFVFGLATAGFLFAGGSAETKHDASLPRDTVIVTDDLGRSVAVPARPQRVVALTRSFIEQILAVKGPLVAKVDEYKNRPEGVALPSIGRQAAPNVEMIAALKPDLIFANVRQHTVIAEALESTGAAVYFMDPNKFETDPMLDRIVLFGKLLRREKEAELYLARLDKVTAELRARVAATGYRSGIMLQPTKQGLSAAMPTGQFGWFFLRLGVENVVPAGLPGAGQSTWVPYSQEAVLTADPDVVLLRSSSEREADIVALKEEFMRDPAWKQLSAVRNGNVFVMPPSIDVGNIGNEAALRAVAKLLAP